jgi:hypothetical protein
MDKAALFHIAAREKARVARALEGRGDPLIVQPAICTGM